MSKRENIVVTQEEMDIQREIINRLKQNNDIIGKNKKMFVVTYGCQQNASDSEKLKGMLSEMGYEDTDNREQADIILYNTCCVRENAELKVYGNIGELKILKKNNPNLIIGICGCMMQQPHIVEFIKSKYKQVDMIFGTHNLYKFPEILEKAMKEKKILIDILNEESKIVENLPVMRESKSRALVTIMYGCNNFCSYCIVPYVRGRERSRTPEFIINEIKQLVSDGCKEVTLLGQNVNSYGKDLEEKTDFADLLKMINEIDGIERIRFMTSHPKDISDKLIETMSQCKNVCEHLHLPFQSGSNKILEAMNRKYTKEEYLEKVRKIKDKMPNIAFSTDIIVGFPGETEEDFQETLDIVKSVEFDQIFMFVYSPRKGTPAYDIKDQIDEKLIKINFQKLKDMENEISIKIHKQYENKIVDILVEGESKTNQELLTGRTRTSKIVNFKGDFSLIDKIVNVKITKSHPWFLSGELT